jgi:hypothetical protein
MLPALAWLWLAVLATLATPIAWHRRMPALARAAHTVLPAHLAAGLGLALALLLVVWL